MIRAIQNALKLWRTIEITVPISLAIAQQNIRAGLESDIILSGKFKVRRYYWGNADFSQVRFVGPKARKQFCFCTHGQLMGNQHETRFLGTMRLRNFDFYQVICAALLLITVLTLSMKSAAIAPIMALVGFLYGMTQWHFEVYQREITHILTQLLKAETPSLP